MIRSGARVAILLLLALATPIVALRSAIVPGVSANVPRRSNRSALPYTNCRLGVGSSGQIAAYATEVLNLGWYVNWRTDLHPPRPGGIEYVQMVRLQQTGPTTYAFQPSAAELGQTALANPGSVWLIGNEPDRRAWQDDVTPALYARAYHELYTLLKSADPTAQVAVGGIVQATPLRLRYLDMVRQTYRQLYGKELPADLWNIHTFVLREEADSWGADLPPGIETAIGYSGAWVTENMTAGTVHTSAQTGDQAVLSFEGNWASWTALHSPAGGRVRVSVDHQYRETVSTTAAEAGAQVHSYTSLGYGRHALTLEVVGDGAVRLDEFHAASLGSAAMQDSDLYPSLLAAIRDHDDLDLMQSQIVAFRRWMADHGERDKPLIISEYGVLFPEYIVDEDGNTFGDGRVAAFMTGSFDRFRSLRDSAYGLPADGGRLVQRWAWYSLADPYFNGALFDNITRQITPLGTAFRDYAAQIAPQADLLPLDVTTEPLIPIAPAGPVSVTLHLAVANAGNVDLPVTTTLRVWDGDPDAGGALIGDAVLPPGLAGCGATADVVLAWPATGVGFHHLVVQVDPDDVLAEVSETNNRLSRDLFVGRFRYLFPIVFWPPGA